MEHKNLCVRVANFANELKLWIFGNKKHQENPDVRDIAWYPVHSPEIKPWQSRSKLSKNRY